MASFGRAHLQIPSCAIQNPRDFDSRISRYKLKFSLFSWMELRLSKHISLLLVARDMSPGRQATPAHSTATDAAPFMWSRFRGATAWHISWREGHVRGSKVSSSFGTSYLFEPAHPELKITTILSFTPFVHTLT